MLRLGFAFVIGIALTACGESADEKENPVGATSRAGSLSDAELIGVLNATINANTALAGAGGRVTNGNVRAFVESQTITATNARANVDRIANELGIEGVDTDFATGIITASSALVEQLGAVADNGYDDAFLVSVSDTQSAAADAFANDFAGSGNARVASLMNGMGQALAYEAGYAAALQNGYDASAFLAANQSPNSSGIGSGGGSVNAGTGNGGGSGTGTGTGTGTGDPGTGSGSGSGSDGGLGGDGTDTGNGQDPGGSVGTGNPSDGDGLGGDGTDTGAGAPP